VCVCVRNGDEDSDESLLSSSERRKKRCRASELLRRAFLDAVSIQGWFAYGTGGGEGGRTRDTEQGDL
jgi:hypothetical protein